MPPGLVFSTSLDVGKAVFGGYGYFTSIEEKNIVVVHPHSIELLDFLIMENQAQTIMESTLPLTVYSAAIIKQSECALDKIVILTIDFCLMLVSFEEGECNCKKIHDFRIEKAKPNNNILMINLGNIVYISLYREILYEVTFTDTINIKEIKIEDFEPTKMRIFNNYFAFQQNMFIYVTDHFDTIKEQESTFKNFYKCIVGKKVEFWDIFDDKIIICRKNQLNITPLSLFAVKSLRNATYIDIPVKSEVSCILETDLGLVISLMNSDVYIFADNQFSKIIECPAINQMTILVNGIALLITRWNGFCIADLAEQFFITPADDLGYIRMHALLPHTTEGLDKLVICNGVIPSDLHTYAQALPFQQTAVIDSIKAVSIFPTEPFILVSGSNNSICLDSDYEEFVHPSLELNERTLAFSIVNDNFLVQVVPSKIIATSASTTFILEGEFEHATISENCILTSSSSLGSVIEMKEDRFEVIRTFTISGEISTITSFGDDIIIITTWNSSPIILVRKSDGEVISEFTDTSYIFSSVCIDEDVIFFGATTGAVLAATIDKNNKIVIRKEIILSDSSVSVSSGTQKNTIFVSGNAPTLITHNNDKFNAIPMATGPFRFASKINDETMALIRDNEVEFGILSAPIITKLKSMRYKGIIKELCTDYNNKLVCFIGGKDDKNELKVLNDNLEIISSDMIIQKNYSFYSLCSINIKKHQFYAISCGKKDGSGSVIFYEFRDNNLTFMNELNFDHIVTAAAFNGTNFIVASGSVLVLHSIELSDSNDLILQTVTAQKASTFTSKLVTSGTRVMNLDLFKSHAIYQLSYNDLSMENVDYDMKKLICGDFLGDYGSLTGTIYGELYGMSGSSGSFAMTTFSRFRVGDIVTTISRWRLDSNQDNSFIATTLSGSVLKISGVDTNLYQKLNIVQNMIIKTFKKEEEKHNRSLITPFYSEEAFGFIDGDLITIFEGNIDELQKHAEVTPEITKCVKEWIEKNKKSNFS